MKQLVLIAILTLAFSVGVNVSAHGLNEIFGMLEVPEPSLLPTNPFYFLKEWGRGVRLFFTADPVKKAELELRFADEKLAELEKLAVTKPDKPDALDEAFENYLAASDRLQQRLESLRGTNQNVDALLEKLARRILDHSRLFEDFEGLLAGEKLDQATAEIAGKAKVGLEINKEKFKAKLKVNIEREDEDDLEDVDIIEDLAELDEELEKEFEDLTEELAEDIGDDAKSGARAPEKAKSCIVTGCSNQVCAAEPVITTCEWKEEYACYWTARCEIQSDGQCGWTETPGLKACLDKSQKLQSS